MYYNIKIPARIQVILIFSKEHNVFEYLWNSGLSITLQPKNNCLCNAKFYSSYKVKKILNIVLIAI